MSRFSMKIERGVTPGTDSIAWENVHSGKDLLSVLEQHKWNSTDEIDAYTELFESANELLSEARDAVEEHEQEMEEAQEKIEELAELLGIDAEEIARKLELKS